MIVQVFAVHIWVEISSTQVSSKLREGKHVTLSIVYTPSGTISVNRKSGDLIVCVLTQISACVSTPSDKSPVCCRNRTSGDLTFSYPGARVSTPSNTISCLYYI